MKQYATFWKSMFKHPVQTGAIAPSSKYLARTMVKGLPLENARCIVELGPGTGAFTKVVLPKLGKQTIFLAIERSPIMAKFLHEEFPNIEVICDSAENLEKYLKKYQVSADYIFSGLPLSWLPQEVVHKIIKTVYKSLKPNGKFAMFQYIHSSMTPMGRQVQKELKKQFGNIHISHTLRNLPPALVLTCEKK